MSLLFKMALDVEAVRQFPQAMWKAEPTERWEALCNQLQTYDPPVARLKITHPERKWEVVSAYQKCVRRGMTARALWLVGGFLSFPTSEAPYFWKRICTTAAEDIGYADPELMNFVVACSMTYRTKTETPVRYAVWCFLTEQLCTGPKSRIYCQLSIIENFVQQGLFVPDLTPEDRSVILNLALPVADTEKARWAVKNNWRAEGMLKYQGWHLETAEAQPDLPPPTMLKDLPDFCYDMHTRVGKQMITRLTTKFPFDVWVRMVPKKSECLGYLLFFREGGLIPGGLVNSGLFTLEHKYLAAHFEVPLEKWIQGLTFMQYALKDGTINDLRNKVLDLQAY